MPYCIVRQTNHREIHFSCHLRWISENVVTVQSADIYLAETLGFCMLLETESWEMDTVSENASFGKDTDTSDSVDLHLHIWITVRVSEVGQMWPPCGVLGITLNNHSIFIQGICQS